MIFHHPKHDNAKCDQQVTLARQWPAVTDRKTGRARPGKTTIFLQSDEWILRMTDCTQLNVGGGSRAH